MSDDLDLTAITPDHVFDGGELDCGSGLVLLLREAMLKVPMMGILEMRSTEPTVGDDLPPWCRMAGHQFLGSLTEGVACRHFIKRGGAPEREAEALAEDRDRAKKYEWRVRARSTGKQKTSVYCRKFTIIVGQPASFEESDANPSAVEYLLSALAGDLATGYFTECSRLGLELDDVEITANGQLHNVFAHLGSEPGDPSFAKIDVKCHATSFADERALKSAWETTVQRSPTAATLAKATTLNVKFSVV